MFKVKVILEELSIVTTGGEGNVSAAIEIDIELPFVPFPGLVLELPNDAYPEHKEIGGGLDLLTVQTTYWVHPESRFDVEVDLHVAAIRANTKAEALESFLKAGWRERR